MKIRYKEISTLISIYEVVWNRIIYNAKATDARRER